MRGLLESEIREHGARTRGHQQGHVMGVDDLSAFDDQRNVVCACLDHRLPGRGQGHQRRQRRTFRVYAAIGQQNESRSFGRSCLYVCLQTRQRGFRRLHSILGKESERDAFRRAQFFFQQLQLPAIEQR